MKTVLINLPSPWLISDRDTPSMGILYVAANLRPENRVEVCDLAGLLEEHWHIPDGDIFGISTTTPQYPYALKVIQKLRERQTCKIVVGGFHPTVLPERTLSETGADYVVVGEGEMVMRLIVRGFAEPGIVIAKQIEGIDSLPFPAVDMLDIYDYFAIGTNAYVAGAKREAYIQTARGCPYNCAFCCQNKMWRGKVRNRSIENVMSEARHYVKRYNVDQIYLNDDLFIIDPRRVKDFCCQFSRLGIPWHCMSRVDCVDLQIMRLMYESGCRAITFGIESGSNRMLSQMGKRFAKTQSIDAINQAKEAGLKVRCQMIVGFPGETESSVQETADFIKAVPADRWGIHAFVPFPGCDVWDHPEKYDFPFKKESVDFGNFHTIGKPGEWHAIISPYEEKTRAWLDFLIQTAKDRNIFKQDARLK